MATWMLPFVLACRSGTGTPPVAAPDAAAPETAPWSEHGLARQMQHHFSSATDGIWYLAHDDLDTMRSRVTGLLHAPHGELPEALSPFAARMRESATAWAMAASREAAAAASADVANRCADCHLTSGAIPPLTPGEIELANLEPLGKHSMAPYYLWVGLVLPSDRAWKTGATHLALPEDPAVEGEAGEAYAAIGGRARRAGPDGKRDVWIELIGSCATCHGPDAAP